MLSRSHTSETGSVVYRAYMLRSFILQSMFQIYWWFLALTFPTLSVLTHKNTLLIVSMWSQTTATSVSTVQCIALFAFVCESAGLILKAFFLFAV